LQVDKRTEFVDVKIQQSRRTLVLPAACVTALRERARNMLRTLPRILDRREPGYEADS